MRAPLLAIVAAILLGGHSAAAQPAFHITNALVNAPHPTEVSVTFSDPLATTGPHTSPSTVRLAGAPGVTVSKVSLSLLGLGEGVSQPWLTATLSAALPPGEVKICFDRVSYVRAAKVFTTPAELCAPVSSDIASARAAALKELTDTPVPPDEKALNASGFVTTSSASSAGGADLAFNPKLSDPRASVFFRLKKSTADKGDARHFEVGAAYRAGIPWRRARLQQMRAASDLLVLNDLLLEQQRSLIAGSVVDFRMKLEGEPTTFDAANGVGETHYEILTATKPLGVRQGFWRAYAIPAGAEIGRRLGTTATGTPSTKHDWIARYKAGAGVSLFFRALQPSRLPLSRVELDLHTMWRYLAFDELNFNTKTKAIDRTIDGGHAYGQLALKAFFADTASGRFGVKASCNRGSLPPVFAAVKSCEFGFVVESSDKE